MWIRTTEALQALADSLRRVPVLAVDTEADSLHHYPEKLCLLQLGWGEGEGALIDPLALPGLAPLLPVFGDPAVLKVFHAADNDLAYLKRLHGFTVASLFDTAIAARFLGATALRLEGLLWQYLGVAPVASRQKDDWSRRPLSPEQEAYALNDVAHLIPLRERLVEELRSRGREAWVEEECAALAALPASEKRPDPDAYLALKGSRELDPRALAVLRELHRMREGTAVALDRPPFKVLGNEALVRLAALRPRDTAAILTVTGCTPKVVRRLGTAILEAVSRGEAVPASDLPVRQAPARRAVPARVRRRVEALKGWRRAAAERLGLEPGLLLPQRLIDRLAESPPVDRGALAMVDGMRRWRADLIGEELLGILSGG